MSPDSEDTGIIDHSSYISDTKFKQSKNHEKAIARFVTRYIKTGVRRTLGRGTVDGFWTNIFGSMLENLEAGGWP